MPSLKVWFEESAKPEQIEWFSLLGPITRLSVFPREFVSGPIGDFFVDMGYRD